VLSKEYLSPLEIPLVSQNSSLLIRVQQTAKAMVIATIPQNVQRNTAFALVVRLFVVFLLKEKGEVFLSNPEYALVG
jgi:hypothetical protein